MSRSSVAPASSRISAPSSGVWVVTGEVAPARDPRKTRMDPARSRQWLGTVVLERRLHVACPVRQRHPQLRTVQHVGLRSGKFRVADAASGGHQVDLAGPHGRVEAGRVPVFDLPGKEPADRLQSGVRVPWHVHAPGLADPVRAVVVQEAPGADEAPLALRQGPSDVHGPRPAQRDLAGNQDFDAGRRRRPLRKGSPEGPPRYCSWHQPSDRARRVGEASASATGAMMES